MLEEALLSTQGKTTIFLTIHTEFRVKAVVMAFILHPIRDQITRHDMQMKVTNASSQLVDD